MKTKLITILLCLFPLLAYAQNYEQKGDELFAEAQYEQALKKYKAAEVSAEMNGQQTSSKLKQKKEKAQKCATLLSKAKSAEENNQYSEAAKAYEDLFALHTLASYQKKSQMLKSKSSSTQFSSNQQSTTNQNTKQDMRGTVDLVIPDGVREIKLKYCDRRDIRTVSIPNSVNEISTNAFAWCTNLKSINVADDNPNYSSIDGVLFNKNKTKLILYPGGKSGFYTIPNSVTSIEGFAFYRCSGLTSIDIPNSVTSIGGRAFMDCTALTSIMIPNSVTSIDDAAFSGCSSLTSINVEVSNPNYCSIDGVLFNKNKTKLIRYPGGKSGFYAIPNSVTWIGEGAFYGCSGLTSVTIPNSVTSIGIYAFHGCTSLTSVTIPNSVTSIGRSAFANCTGLTSVTIPNSVTFIAWGAFNACKGLRLQLPERFQGKVDVQNCRAVIYY